MNELMNLSTVDLGEAYEDIKVKKCMLCGRGVDKMIHSHSIPSNLIAKSKTIYFAQNRLSELPEEAMARKQRGENLKRLEYIKYGKSAGVFKMLCTHCELKLSKNNVSNLSETFEEFESRHYEVYSNICRSILLKTLLHTKYRKMNDCILSIKRGYKPTINYRKYKEEMEQDIEFKEEIVKGRFVVNRIISSPIHYVGINFMGIYTEGDKFCGLKPPKGTYIVVSIVSNETSSRLNVYSLTINGYMSGDVVSMISGIEMSNIVNSFITYVLDFGKDCRDISKEILMVKDVKDFCTGKSLLQRIKETKAKK